MNNNSIEKFPTKLPESISVVPEKVQTRTLEGGVPTIKERVEVYDPFATAKEIVEILSKGSNRQVLETLKIVCSIYDLDVKSKFSYPVQKQVVVEKGKFKDKDKIKPKLKVKKSSSPRKPKVRSKLYYALEDEEVKLCLLISQTESEKDKENFIQSLRTVRRKMKDEKLISPSKGDSSLNSTEGSRTETSKVEEKKKD